MRRLAVASVLWLCALSTASRAGNAPVIGGHVADNKKWPDAVAVFFGNQQGCTGILLAPTLVITAAHCNDPRDPPTSVLIGANNLTRPQDGEMIAAKTVTSYPNWDNGGVDIALIVLDHASTIAPRTIATGWAAADIQNGAELTIVGWGATDEQANAIVNGITDANHRYVVGVGGNTRAFCTGTVISRRTVLTAGHCIGGVKNIFLGTSINGGAGTKIPVVDEIQHPMYRDLPNENATFDLGILHLGADAPVQPAPLFRDTMANSPRFIGPSFVFSGYGATSGSGETATSLDSTCCDQVCSGRRKPRS